MTVDVPPSSIVRGSAVTVIVRFARTTVASCVTTAAAEPPAVSAPVTVIVAAPAPIGVRVSVFPVLIALTTSGSLDPPWNVAVTPASTSNSPSISTVAAMPPTIQSPPPAALAMAAAIFSAASAFARTVGSVTGASSLSVTAISICFWPSMPVPE